MFSLEQVVPWGRSFDEYCAMFALSDSDLAGSILGCGDGPASFNAAATKRGLRVVSVDPLYRFSADDIRGRLDATYERIMAETQQNAGEFVWSVIPSVDDLGRVRMAAMSEFLADFPAGRRDGRYLDGELPSLPFDDRTFDLAVCSHLLFLYSTQLGEAFHHSALLELCRVARQVRVFPLLALGGAPSPFVASSTQMLRERGYDVTIERVPYEFQRGGNEMMRIDSSAPAACRTTSW